MNKRRKLLLQAGAVVGLGVATLFQPDPAGALTRSAGSSCGVCVAGPVNVIDFCLGDFAEQNAACSEFCGSFAAEPDCGSAEGNAGCGGNIGFNCF